MGANARWRRGFRKNESGVAAIEFAALAFPFFITIFSLVEIGIVFAGELTLDNAVDRIGRELRTGQMQLQQPPPTREEFNAKVCDNVSFLLDCSKLDIDLSVHADYGSIPGGPPMKNGAVDKGALKYELGAGGQIMTLSVYYDWPIITHVLREQINGGKHLMSGVAAFQTETF